MTYQPPTNGDHANRPPKRRRTLAVAPLAVAAAAMLAACGSTHTNKLTPNQQAKAEAPLITYANWMRSHGASDFPNPSISSLGGIGYSKAQAHAINRTSPTYHAAQQACQNLPGATIVQRLLK